MLISGDRPSRLCPCGSQKPLAQCCAPYLQGQLAAPTAEALMQSRYTAYCFRDVDYLLKTEHPSRHTANSRQLITATANSVSWLSLTVLATAAGQPQDETGMVEFVAVYQKGKTVGQLHERSQFIKEKGRWFYLEGDILPPLQPKKNEPCWCNSGKKFKQCHGKKR
ncbi:MULTISPECIES: YchJ family protein [Cyanophyceae]|uniref:YchJ family protein n=1 Tax=Cyanophyceae TaxID=3028117 RepID=UPI00059DD894|nr:MULTISPECIES: YchJ family protein [Cyanophyceae]ANV91631.1 zinc chelation protein SecC [Picosynechococcus sp. PCC 8807]SMH51520.1 SEC-C motif-containing protein [Picosynechococcus sp. OG1]SMQ82097.1 SEC-C motif-containing protein [Synechococcus sp. 7002]